MMFNAGNHYTEPSRERIELKDRRILPTRTISHAPQPNEYNPTIASEETKYYKVPERAHFQDYSPRETESKFREDPKEIAYI